MRWRTPTEDNKRGEGTRKENGWGKTKIKQKWVKNISRGGRNQLTDHTVWRRTNGLEYKEKRKEKDQLKDDAV